MWPASGAPTKSGARADATDGLGVKKYPILGADGAKLVKEDLETGWSIGGAADDLARTQFAQIVTEATNRSGYVIPEQDIGGLVQTNGATGQVLVKPFTAFRSGLTSGTQQDLLSAYYAGSTETVTTPLPGVGNHRWDLLYAIIAETDSDSESRLVENPGTEVIAAQTVNTRHKSVVTLAWVQGTAAGTGTTPYPAGNFPALPTPSAGQAHIPIAYVHVSYSATPSTVSYGVDAIINDPQHAKMNPLVGGVSVGSVGLVQLDVTPNYGRLGDTKGLVTGTGTPWTTGTGNRPGFFLEPVLGETKVYLLLDFRGGGAIGSAWAVINQPILDPADTTSAIYRRLGPYSLSDRIFEGRLFPASSDATENWAWNQAASAGNRVFPTRHAHTATHPSPIEGLGNTVYKNGDFETASGFTAGDWFLACLFKDVLSSGTNSDIALLVRKAAGGGYTQGAMYVATREATNGDIEGRAFWGHVTMTTRLNAFGF